MEPPLSPVALECVLPWKRTVCSQESNPIPSRVNHLLPDDNRPALAQVPSWANNLDYNNIPAVSPRSDPDDSSATTTFQLSAPDSSDSISGSPLLSSDSTNRKNSESSEPELKAIGRALPSIPLIQVYNAENGHVGQGASGSTEGLLQTASQTNGVSSASVSPASTSSPVTSPTLFISNPGPESESDEDEEVEIRPFGKIDLTGGSGSPVLSSRPRFSIADDQGSSSSES